MLIAQEGQFIPLPSLRWWDNHSYVCKRALLIYGERSIPTSTVKKVRVRNLYFFESLDLNLRFVILDFLPPCCSLESSFLILFRSPYHSMSIVKHLRTRFRESTKVEQAVASTSSWKMLMRKIWFQRKVGAKHLGERKEGVGYISVNSRKEFKVYKANKRFWKQC